MEKFKKWKKGDLVKDEKTLTNLEEKEKKALDKVKKSYEKSKEKATAKVAVGRMGKIKKEVETMVTAWEPGDTEKGNDPDSMKKLFLQAMLKEIGTLLATLSAKQPDKVKAAVEVKPQKEPEKETKKETKKEPEKETEKETEKEPEKETEKIKSEGPVKVEPENNEITTLFQLLHAENRNLRWK